MERKYSAFFGSQELPENIAEWWNHIIKKVLIGHGRHSSAYIATTQDNKKYIVRLTPVVGVQERQALQHEIGMYERLKKHTQINNYVSELLYADIPTIYHDLEIYDNAYFILDMWRGCRWTLFCAHFKKQRLI